MRIFSFDVACKNMGVAIIEFNTEWRAEIAQLTAEVMNIAKPAQSNQDIQAKPVGHNMICVIYTLLKKINVFLDNIIRIEWINTVDVIPAISYKSAKISDISAGLKNFLTWIDYACGPRPDLVLIETQMKHNDTTRLMSVQIEYHYIPVNLNNPGTYAFAFHVEKQLEQKQLEQINPPNTRIAFIGGALKNTVQFCADGLYSKFAVRYAKSYDANKAHTCFNFEQYLKIFNTVKLTAKANVVNTKKLKKRKLDDVADAFMMCVSYLHQQKLI